MKFQRILFPTDFSHTGDAALGMAAALARDNDATLYIVHVQEPPAFYGGGEMYYGMLDPTADELAKMLHAVVPADAEVSHEHHLITGDPATALVEFADSRDIDLIVMGTHGRGGLSRLLMGSVAEAVVRRANCPVLTFKQPQTAAADG
jgi:nucleotide-binding universal stress UspA family protein